MKANLRGHTGPFIILFFLASSLFGFLANASESVRCEAIFSEKQPRISENNKNRFTFHRTSLFSALDDLIRNTSASELKWLFTPETIEEVKNGATIESLTLEVVSTPLEEQLPSSLNDFVRLSLQGVRSRMLTNISLSVIGNKIFWNGYFWSNGLENPGSTMSLVHSQPWLEYDLTTNRLAVHKLGADKALMQLWFKQKLGPTVTLYRGLTMPHETYLLQVLKILSQDAPLSAKSEQALLQAWQNFRLKWPQFYEPSEKADQIFQSFNAELEKLDLEIKNPRLRLDLAQRLSQFTYRVTVALGRDALFFTPDLSLAEQWDSYGVIAFKISKAMVENLNNKKGIFIGVEKKIEVALISEEAQLFFLKNFFKP